MSTFPRWIIRLREGESKAGLRYWCDDRGNVIGFDQLDVALDYLVKNLQPGMRLHRLKLTEAILLVADMHESDVAGMCLDPTPGGVCAGIIPLEALAAALNEPLDLD